MKMAYTCARAEDLEALIKFYQKAFGFEGSRHRNLPKNKFIPVYLILPGDNYELELAYNHDHGAYDLGNDYGHMAIAADDLEKLHEQHRAAGLEIIDLKRLPGTAPSYYSVIDPDGYKVEVIRG